jgi:hypothetical protein
MRTSVIIITLLLGTLSCQTVATSPKGEVDEAATVQHDVRVMNDALFSGDTATLRRYTFPPIIEKVGGAEAFDKLYKGVAESQRQAGIRRDSLSFPTPPEFIAGKNQRRFVLVPIKITVSRGSDSAAISGFHLGVKEPGAEEWKYISGQFIKSETLPALLPDFPADHPLPPRSTEKLSS